MGRKRPRVGGQGGGHSYGGAGVGDVPPGGLTRVDLGQAHQGAGVWAWSEWGGGGGKWLSAPKKQVGRWASGRAGGPSHLSSQGVARAGWSGSWDSQQVSPPGSPVPTPCLAESLSCFLVLMTHPLLTPEHLSFLPPEFSLPLSSAPHTSESRDGHLFIHSSNMSSAAPLN